MNMSAGHLSRQFRLAYGESPYRYLMTRRIERAMALLRRGDLSVTDVCFEVGCSSLGTFSTRFTELVGMPPSVYRREAAGATAGMPSLRGETGDPTGQESRSAMKKKSDPQKREGDWRGDLTRSDPHSHQRGRIPRSSREREMEKAVEWDGRRPGLVRTTASSAPVSRTEL